ncbi:hypothetical protein ACFYR1_11150 [Streptomyces canus]|uniref:hypothetical protein n=1 Tax=Streptomyces canus TaxID=58343 RepID=UPI0036D1E7F8
MTDHDIQVLCVGITAGADLMLLVQLFFARLDDRRDRKALLAAQAKLKAAEEGAAA